MPEYVGVACRFGPPKPKVVGSNPTANISVSQAECLVKHTCPSGWCGQNDERFCVRYTETCFGVRTLGSSNRHSVISSSQAVLPGHRPDRRKVLLSRSVRVFRQPREYDRVIGEWLSTGRDAAAALAAPEAAEQSAGPTVSVIASTFMTYAEIYQSNKDQFQTSEQTCYGYAIGVLRKLSGSTPAAESVRACSKRFKLR